MHNHFRPLSGAHNPHLQTLLPRLIRRHAQFSPVWQPLELPDGDFVDLAKKNELEKYNKIIKK